MIIPVDKILAKKLAQKIPEAAISALDVEKLQLARLVVLAASILLLILPINPSIKAFLASLLFAVGFCLLPEVAEAVNIKLPGKTPLRAFGDASCLLLFFTVLGYTQVVVTRSIGSLFLGLMAGVATGLFVVGQFVLRQKLAEQRPDAEPPAMTLLGYKFDDLLYLLPVFVLLEQTTTWALLIALLGSALASGVVFYKYYKIMEPGEE